MSNSIYIYFEKWGICYIKCVKKVSVNIISVLFVLSSYFYNKFENWIIWLENKIYLIIYYLYLDDNIVDFR